MNHRIFFGVCPIKIGKNMKNLIIVFHPFELQAGLVGIHHFQTRPHWRCPANSHLNQLWDRSIFPDLLWTGCVFHMGENWARPHKLAKKYKKHPDSMTRWTLTRLHVMIVFSNQLGSCDDSSIQNIQSQSSGAFSHLFPAQLWRPPFCVHHDAQRCRWQISCWSMPPAAQIKRPMISAWGRGSLNRPPGRADQGMHWELFEELPSPNYVGYPSNIFKKIAYSKRILLVFPILMSISEGASGFPHLPWSSLIWFGHDLVYKPRLLLRSTIKPYFIW